MDHRKKKKDYIKEALLCIFILSIATGVGYLFQYIKFPDTNIVIVYLLAVLLTARYTKGFIFGLTASIIATFCFNYFFTIPYYTLSVDNPSYIVTFIIMTFIAFFTSTLTSRVMLHALQAKEKEAETRALYTLTNRLTDAQSMKSIAEIAVETISEYMNCQAACLLFNEEGMPEGSFIQQVERGRQVRRETDEPEELKHRFSGLRTDFLIGGEFYDWPIYGQEDLLGLIRIPGNRGASITGIQMRLLHSMIENVGIAMDRLHSSMERIRDRELIVQERYRSNLLRAISHDLRTPLSGIMGTSEVLMNMTDKKDSRYSMMEGIYMDADWLHSLVENILSLTRLRDGKVPLHKELEAVEEVIGDVLQHMEKHKPQIEIKAVIPDELLLVPMDARLISQVLVNLLDNAVKHTKGTEEISIEVVKDNNDNTVKFYISDRGEGIKEKDLPNIFEMFYTSKEKHADARQGIGLGLSICEAIVKAHGGTIQGGNRIDGKGAIFTFALPLSDDRKEDGNV